MLNAKLSCAYFDGKLCCLLAKVCGCWTSPVPKRETHLLASLITLLAEVFVYF